VSASISRSTVLNPSYALGAAFQRGGWFWKRLSRTFMPSNEGYRSDPPFWMILPHMAQE